MITRKQLSIQLLSSSETFQMQKKVAYFICVNLLKIVNLLIFLLRLDVIKYINFSLFFLTVLTIVCSLLFLYFYFCANIVLLALNFHSCLCILVARGQNFCKLRCLLCTVPCVVKYRCHFLFFFFFGLLLAFKQDLGCKVQ